MKFFVNFIEAWPSTYYDLAITYTYKLKTTKGLKKVHCLLQCITHLIAINNNPINLWNVAFIWFCNDFVQKRLSQPDQPRSVGILRIIVNVVQLLCTSFENSFASFSLSHKLSFKHVSLVVFFSVSKTFFGWAASLEKYFCNKQPFLVLNIKWFFLYCFFLCNFFELLHFGVV